VGMWSGGQTERHCGCRGAAEGSGLKRCTSVGASMGIDLSPDLPVKAIWYDTEAFD